MPSQRQKQLDINAKKIWIECRHNSISFLWCFLGRRVIHRGKLHTLSQYILEKTKSSNKCWYWCHRHLFFLNKISEEDTVELRRNILTFLNSSYYFILGIFQHFTISELFKQLVIKNYSPGLCPKSLFIYCTPFYFVYFSCILNMFDIYIFMICQRDILF